MKIKSERDFCSGLMFVVVGVGFAVGATGYSLGSSCVADDPCAASPWLRFAQLSSQPGPGYFPLGLGILLAIVGAFVLFKSLALESENGDPIGAIAWRPLFAIVVAMVVFAVALRPLGLVASVLLLVAVSSLATEERRWKETLAVALVLAAITGAAAAAIGAAKTSLPLWPQLFG